MKLIVVLAVFAISLVVNAQTPVQKCPNGATPSDNKQVIHIGECVSHPCRLKQKTVMNVTFKFTPNKLSKTLRNTVSAKLGIISLPFIGVDGTDACPQLFKSDETTKAGCPVEPGVEYVYKNQFEIYDYYPKLKLTVHWGLTSDDSKDLLCFEVPAKITS